jgi:hypothetical protein
VRDGTTLGQDTGEKSASQLFARKNPGKIRDDAKRRSHRAFLAGAFGLMCTHLRVRRNFFSADQLLGDLF